MHGQKMQSPSGKHQERMQASKYCWVLALKTPNVQYARAAGPKFIHPCGSPRHVADMED